MEKGEEGGGRRRKEECYVKTRKVRRGLSCLLAHTSTNKFISALHK